jgi:hypothetical protein
MTLRTYVRMTYRRPSTYRLCFKDRIHPLHPMIHPTRNLKMESARLAPPGKTGVKSRGLGAKLKTKSAVQVLGSGKGRKGDAAVIRLR